MWKFLFENLQKNDHLEDLDANVRIILRYLKEGGYETVE
jgi:hypothetical protein